MTDTTASGQEVAALLLAISAVTIRVSPPFRFRSGLLSPIYTDNRLLCSYPAERRRVTEHFARALAAVPRADVLAGVATAGIPHAAWLADRLNLPMVYVRGEAKDHGKGKRVEGKMRPQANADSEAPPNVVIVEDLVTTGGGALEAVAAVREEGGRVETCLAICTYGFPRAAAAFAAAGVALVPLCTFEDLVTVATREGRIAPAEVAVALDWRRDAEGWAGRHGMASDG